jgi:hypothetical protein
MKEHNVYDIREFAGKEVIGFKFDGNSVAPWKDEYEYMIGKAGRVVYCNIFNRVIFIDFGDIEIKVPSYEFCKKVLPYGYTIKPYPYTVGEHVDVICHHKRKSDGVEYEYPELGMIKSIRGALFDDMVVTVSLFDDDSGSFKGSYEFPYEKIRPYATKVIYY